MVINMSKLVMVPSNHTIVENWTICMVYIFSVARQQGTHLFRTFPYGVLSQVSNLNVLNPKLCILPYSKKYCFKI